MTEKQAHLHAIRAAIQQLHIENPKWRMRFKAWDGLAFRALGAFEPADNREGFKSRSGESLLDWLRRTRDEADWAYEQDEPAEEKPGKPLSEMTAKERLDFSNGVSPTAKGIGGRDEQ